MKNFVKFQIGAFVLLVLILPYGAAAQYDEEATVDTPKVCAKLQDPCGKKAKRKTPKECCEELVCHLGYCAQTRGIEEACTPSSPPCKEGLSCVSGSCQIRE